MKRPDIARKKQLNKNTASSEKTKDEQEEEIKLFAH